MCKKDIAILSVSLFLLFTNGFILNIQHWNFESNILSHFTSPNAIQIKKNDSTFSYHELKDIYTNCYNISILKILKNVNYTIVFLGSNNTKYFESYLTSGKIFDNNVFFNDIQNAIVGKDIIDGNIENVTVFKDGEKKYVTRLNINYEVIGTIGRSYPTNMDHLLIVNIDSDDSFASNIIIVDSANKRDVQNCYEWINKRYDVNILKPSYGSTSIINNNLYLSVIHLFCIGFLIAFVLIFIFILNKVNTKMIQCYKLIGIKIFFTIKCIITRLFIVMLIAIIIFMVVTKFFNEIDFVTIKIIHLFLFEFIFILACHLFYIVKLYQVKAG